MSIISDEQSPLFITTNQTHILAEIEKEEDGNPARDMDERASFCKNLSIRLKKGEDNLEMNNAVASVLLSMLFVLTTYDIDSGNTLVLWYAELLIICDLCLDWLLFLVMADNRLAYLFNPQAWISYITITSSFICLFSEDIELIDTYELKFMKIIRIFSLSRFEEVLKRHNMPLGRAIFRLVFESIAIIMIFASAMLRIENRQIMEPAIEEALAADPTWQMDSSLYRFRFHDLIYYTVVSITTTGYGDISPKSEAG